MKEAKVGERKGERQCISDAESCFAPFFPVFQGTWQALVILMQDLGDGYTQPREKGESFLGYGSQAGHYCMFRELVIPGC